jgi:hypothetical protein
LKQYAARRKGATKMDDTKYPDKPVAEWVPRSMRDSGLNLDKGCPEIEQAAGGLGLDRAIAEINKKGAGR